MDKYIWSHHPVLGEFSFHERFLVVKGMDSQNLIIPRSTRRVIDSWLLSQKKTTVLHLLCQNEECSHQCCLFCFQNAHLSMDSFPSTEMLFHSVSLFWNRFPKLQHNSQFFVFSQAIPTHNLRAQEVFRSTPKGIPSARSLLQASFTWGFTNTLRLLILYPK